MELQACLMDTFSRSKVVGRQAVILFIQRFSMGLSFGEFASQDRTCTPCVVKSLMVLVLVNLAFWAGAKSCWNVNSSPSKQLLSRRKQEMLEDFLIDSSSDIRSLKTKRSNSNCWHSSPDHGALWKFNAGFRAAELATFVGLSPNSWPSVSKRNAELWLIREDNSRPLSNCPVPLLRGPSQPLLALLKIQERLHPWYAIGLAHFLYSTIDCWSWCRHTISILLLDNFTAVLK